MANSMTLSKEDFYNLAESEGLDYLIVHYLDENIIKRIQDAEIRDLCLKVRPNLVRLNSILEKMREEEQIPFDIPNDYDFLDDDFPDDSEVSEEDGI